MTIYDRIRKDLWDPAKRQETQNAAALAKIGGYVGVALFSAAAIVNAVAIATFPILNTFLLLANLGLALLCRETAVMGNNLETLISGIWALAIASLSADAFVDRMTKDTWIYGPLFKNTIVTFLNREQLA